MGRLLGERGIRLVYGGGNVGLMGVLADAALAAGGEVIGVIPQMLVDKELAHRHLTELRVVGSMHERKALMAELSDAFVALPGGLGTYEELFEVLTWAQLHIHHKPCGCLNVARLLRSARRACSTTPSPRAFCSQQQRRLLVMSSDPGELLGAPRRAAAAAREEMDRPRRDLTWRRVHEQAARRMVHFARRLAL